MRGASSVPGSGRSSAINSPRGVPVFSAPAALTGRRTSWSPDPTVPNIAARDVIRASENTSRQRLNELTSVMNQAIATIGPGPYQLIVLCFGGGVYAAEGSLLLMLSIIAKGLIIRWKLTPLLAGAMATVIFTGMLCGTATGGFCCDRFGRRKPILLTYSGIAVFIFVGIMAPGMMMLLSAKFMLGFFLGFGVPAANAIVAESCPPAHRSNIYCLTMVLFSMGQLYSATIVWCMSPEIKHDEMHWRGMLAAATLLPIVQFGFAFFLLEESPHWLLVNWKIREAEEVVAKMAEWKLAAGVSTEEGEKLDYLVHEDLPGRLRPPRVESFQVFSREVLVSGPGFDAADAADAADGPPPAPSQEKEASGMSLYNRMLRGDGLGVEMDRFKTLFSPSYCRTTLLMLYVCFASNFAYYGMIYGLPDTLKKAAVEADMQPGAKEYDSEGRGWSPAAGVFLGAMSEIPGVCLAIILGITVGRRKNMGFAFTMCSLSLLGVVYCISTRQLVHNVGMVVVLSVKLFLATGYIVVYLYLLECYPTTCRATGLAFCMVFGRFGAGLVPFMYDGAHLLGVEHIWFFIIMSAVIFGAAVATCLLPFETKDAELLADSSGGEQREGEPWNRVYTPSRTPAGVSPTVPIRTPRRMGRHESRDTPPTPPTPAEAEVCADSGRRDSLDSQAEVCDDSGGMIFFSARESSKEHPAGAHRPTA